MVISQYLFTIYNTTEYNFISVYILTSKNRKKDSPQHILSLLFMDSCRRHCNFVIVPIFWEWLVTSVCYYVRSNENSRFAVIYLLKLFWHLFYCHIIKAHTEAYKLNIDVWFSYVICLLKLIDNWYCDVKKWRRIILF